MDQNCTEIFSPQCTVQMSVFFLSFLKLGRLFSLYGKEQHKNSLFVSHRRSLLSRTQITHVVQKHRWHRWKSQICPSVWNKHLNCKLVDVSPQKNWGLLSFTGLLNHPIKPLRKGHMTQSIQELHHKTKRWCKMSWQILWGVPWGWYWKQKTDREPHALEEMLQYHSTGVHCDPISIYLI